MMSQDSLIAFVLQTFFSFIAIINPIGNTPIFLSLVSHLSEPERIKVARTGIVEEHPWLFEEVEDDPESVALTPLGTPILAGPGTITTALSLTGNKSDLSVIFIVIATFALVCLITYICFIYGEKLTKSMSPSFIGVITRLMGLILSVVAVQMIIEGATEVSENLIKRLKVF